MVLNLFGTVAHFVFFESLHGPLLCAPPPRRKGLHFRVSVVCPVIALISKKEKKVFTSGRAILALISEKKVSASESPIPTDITKITLFLTKQPIFRIALWPTAKSPVAHWLRNPGLNQAKIKTHFLDCNIHLFILITSHSGYH